MPGLSHEEHEENPRDAVPVVQIETAMSSGTSLTTSETDYQLQVYQKYLILTYP